MPNFRLSKKPRSVRRIDGKSQTPDENRLFNSPTGFDKIP